MSIETLIPYLISAGLALVNAYFIMQMKNRKDNEADFKKDMYRRHEEVSMKVQGIEKDLQHEQQIRAMHLEQFEKTLSSVDSKLTILLNRIDLKPKTEE